MKNDSKWQKYKNFHNGTSVQTKVIGSNNFTYRIVFSVINDFLKSPKEILDIGCGAGTISFYLANKGNEVFGIDIAENAIKKCSESAKLLKLDKNTTFKVMNFPNEVPDKKFGFVLCSEVIEHLPDDEFALRKIFSLLEPDGIAVISTPSESAPLYKLGLTRAFDSRVGHLRRYTLEDLTKKCKKAGFEIVDTRRTEGILRNFLFLNLVAGKFVRFIKFFLSDFVTWLDNIILRLFGESQIFVIARKV